MSRASLWWGLLFGSVGLGYFIYGKRQKASIPLLCGIGLMAFPYFVSNAWATVAIGALLMATPYSCDCSAARSTATWLRWIPTTAGIHATGA